VIAPDERYNSADLDAIRRVIGPNAFMNVTLRDESHDSADLDAILELIESPGWALVKKRIAKEIERRRDRLEREGVDVEWIRGELAALRMVLTIPESLKEEIRSQL
jgi:hypothetical protein